MTSHIVGGSFGIVALVLCVVFSAIHHNGYAVVSSSIIWNNDDNFIYNVKYISWFKTRKKSKKKYFQILDHCSIFFINSWIIYTILFSDF